MSARRHCLLQVWDEGSQRNRSDPRGPICPLHLSSRVSLQNFPPGEDASETRGGLAGTPLSGFGYFTHLTEWPSVKSMLMRRETIWLYTEGKQSKNTRIKVLCPDQTPQREAVWVPWFSRRLLESFFNLHTDSVEPNRKASLQTQRVLLKNVVFSGLHCIIAQRLSA